MGLDLFLMETVPDYHARWSYGGFAHLRKRLAKEGLGIDLDAMKGFGGETEWPVSDDPLLKLLNHSDCEGDLAGYEVEGLGDRLRDIAAKWTDADDSFGYDRTQVANLAEMADRAAANDGVIVFR